MNRLSGYFFRPFAAFSYHFRTRRLWRKRQLEGSCQYDVVSCVYNVEKYLEDYFRSLTGQILDFASHIRLIMVDDGSTDGSAERIRKWQSRYPKNIVYIRKENGGINTARNVGLDLAEAPWVTFIDPDDFVDCSYFLHVDAFLREHHQESPPERRMKLLACNYIFYREKNGRFRDQHGLRFRFRRDQRLFPSGSPEAIQLSVNSAFFNLPMVRASGLRFDERRWDTFDDAHFTLQYLHNGDPGQVGYAALARYYYRKRSDGSSNMDLARWDKKTYTSVLRESCLELLQSFAAERSQIPRAVQWTIFYHLSFIIRDQAGGFPLDQVLTPEEIAENQAVMGAILRCIDEDIIRDFDPGINRFDDGLKVLALDLKKSSRSLGSAFVNHIAPGKGGVLNQHMHSKKTEHLVAPRSHVSQEMREERQPNKGMVFWLTGLSGSGKSSLAHAAEQILFERSYNVIVLDGDVIRTGLCRDLGFSAEERKENNRRIAELAKILVRNGAVCLCAFISPSEEARQAARQIIGAEFFREIYVSCSIEECERRDPKGFYGKARQGVITNYTGVSSGYEAPTCPDFVLCTENASIDKNMRELVEFVERETARG